jgi:hypothetical protein
MGVLPGIGGVILGAQPSILTYITGVFTSGNAITLPATLQAGDLGVLVASAYNSGNNTTYSVPGDFSMITDGGRGTPVLNATGVVFAKILQASDISRLINTVNGDAEGNSFFVFRPDAPITGFTYNVWNFDYQATAQPALATIDLSVPAVPFVWLGHAGGDPGVSAVFTVNSPAFDATFDPVSSGTGDVRTGYKIYNSPGASGATLRQNDVGSNNLQMTGWISVY